MGITLWLVLGVNAALVVVVAAVALAIHRFRRSALRLPLDPDLRARVLSLERRLERLESRRY